MLSVATAHTAAHGDRLICCTCGLGNVALSPNSTCTTCCGLVVQFVCLAGLLTDSSTISTINDDIYDALGIVLLMSNNVAYTIAMLHLHTAATVWSSKRVSVTRIKFIDVISCGADRYREINKIICLKEPVI